MTHAALRLVAATVAACVVMLLGAAPAFAHTRLLSSDPADESTLDTAPESVSLTFNEDIEARFASMSVVGPDGTNYATGQVSAVGGQVSTTVSLLGPAGVYQVGYRVVSDDGHPVQGKVSFTLTAPGPGASAPSPVPATADSAARPAAEAAPSSAPEVATTAQQAAGDGGAPIWPWIVGAVVLVGAGAAAALRLGRTR
jgi:copper resistance protein C